MHAMFSEPGVKESSGNQNYQWKCLNWCGKDPSCLFIFRHTTVFYSRREPEEPDDATKGRDVFNEKPPTEELLAVSDIGKSVTSSLPESVVMFISFTLLF